MALEENKSPNKSTEMVLNNKPTYAGLSWRLPFALALDEALGRLDVSDRRVHTITAEVFKGMICDQTNTTKIRPFLLSFNGFAENPELGKKEVLDHLLDEYVEQSELLDPMTKISDRSKFKGEGIEYFELVATRVAAREVLVSEVSKESSCAFGIISAFKQKIDRKIPIFRFDSDKQPLGIFKDDALDGHLFATFEYLQSDSREKKDIAPLYDKLPEGIALINVWNIDINEKVQHFLQALRSCLYNCHIWLILDAKYYEAIDSPPEHSNDLTRYRSRLEYLLRSGKICEHADEKREGCITVFAKCEDEEKESVKKLEAKIRRKAKHTGISSLMEPSVQPINVNRDGRITDDSSFHLYSKFLQMVYNKPYSTVPVSWVFLRSLFYRSDEKFISKSDLLEKAKQCNMDDKSLNDFCKFYTSFGSIFDLTLIDPNYKYVIVKPIGFLKALNTLLSPTNELCQEHPLLKYGIVSESVLQNLFGERWQAYIEALISLNLATKIENNSIEDLDSSNNDSHYFVPLCRKSADNREPLYVDPSSVYLVTTLDTPHVRKQALFVDQLLHSIPGSKLVKHSDKITVAVKVVAKDQSCADNTITMISSNPFTQFKISDKSDNEACFKIVEAIHHIIHSKNRKGEVKYMYIVPCAAEIDNQIPIKSLMSEATYHVLPIKDDMHCERCQKAGKINPNWHEALKVEQVRHFFKINFILALQITIVLYS